MATVNVSTWAELTTAINSATEDTTVELTNDIDMNEELPTGVTTTVGGSAYKFTINGNGHKIKKLYSNSIRVFYGRSGTGYIMEINDVDFEDVYLTNSAQFGTNVELHSCSLSIKLENSRIGNGNCTFHYCGLAVTGFGTSYLSYESRAYFYFCNVELNGEFTHVSGEYNDTYVKGNCTAGASTVNGRLAQINATIGFTGNFNSSGKLILYNSETITVPSGSTISANLIPCTTAELMSPNALRAKSFPMW